MRLLSPWSEDRPAGSLRRCDALVVVDYSWVVPVVAFVSLLAWEGHSAVVEVLLQAGAAVDIQNQVRDTVYMYVDDLICVGL